MGYFRPVSEFNIGKKSEYSERVCFSEMKKPCNRQETRLCELVGTTGFEPVTPTV